MPNFEVIAERGLRVRSGPGLRYEDAADPVGCGEVVIAAAKQPTNPKWLAILLEDMEVDDLGYVSRQYVQEVPEEGEPKTPPLIFPVTGEDTPELPLYQNQLLSLFGKPTSQAFQDKYLGIIDLGEFREYLVHVKGLAHDKYFGFYGHRWIAEPTKTALREICRQGLAGELRSFDGCHCIRPMKASNSYSVHSWALCEDWNALTNPFTNSGYASWPRLITDLSDKLVACFAAAGLEWGGLWKSCHDAMHFQLPHTQNWEGSTNPLRPLI